MDSMGPPVGGGAVAFIICVVCWSHEGGVVWSPPRRSVMVHSVQGSVVAKHLHGSTAFVSCLFLDYQVSYF